MKKRLGIILAILLCVLLVFTLVACGNKEGNDSSTTTTTSSITDTQKATASAKIQEYLDAWVDTNATEELVDQKAMLSKDLKKNKASFAVKTGSGNFSVNITKVSYKDGTYTVEVSWDEGKVTDSLTVKAKTVTYTNWSGANSKTTDYTFQEGGTAVLDTIDEMVVAFLNTINDVTANSVTGKFGADGIVGFEAFGLNYGLRVKGNVDLTSKAAKENNELALSVVNGAGNDIAAIYYSGKEDKFYIQYESEGKTVYRYLDYATLFGWIYEAFKSNGVDFANKKAGDGVFADFAEIESLEDLLLESGVSMAPMITGVIDELAKAYKNKDGRIMIDINLSEVLGKVSDIISGLGADFEVPFLGDLGIELSTMHGLKGHITISAMVKDDKLSDVEIAVNIPKDTKFYRSATDTKPISIPSVGFAIYIKDFSFVSGDKTIDNVLPSAEALKTARYFSPTNFDLEGDVYVKAGKVDSTFHFDFVTEINPLEILYNGADSEAKAALSIKQNKVKGDVAFDAETASNFLTITYEQKTKELCVSGTAFGLDDGTTWYTYAFDSKDKIVEDVMMWLGLTNWIGIDFDMERGIYLDETKENWPAKESAQVIFGDALVQRLMAYFMGELNDYLAEKSDNDVEEGGDVSEASNPMDLIGGYVDAIKDLYNSLISSKVLVISTDPFSFSLNANQEAINTIFTKINAAFGTTINEPLKDDEGNVIKDEKGNPIILMEVNLEDVKVEINSEGYTKKLFANVKYDGKVFELTVDVDGKFSVAFSYTGTNKITYNYLFEVTGKLSDWTAKFEYNKVSDGVKSDEIIVKVSNFKGEWGNDNKDEIAEIIPTADAKKAASSIFPKEGTGPATQLVKGLLYLASANDKVEEAVEDFGRMIIRQLDFDAIIASFAK